MVEKFGLIGKTLKHSYSKIIHEKFGGYEYGLYEVAPSNLEDFVCGGNLKGFNVTIPYKKDVIPFLDQIDKSAKLIGAVNTVIKRGGKLFGYNTDFKGMLYMLSKAGVCVKGKKVMILGTGGTGNTARAVCEYLGAREIVIVSRSGKINYDNYKEHCDSEVVINTTPVGMYPDNYSSPISLGCFNNLLGVADVIYNPCLTNLLYQAKERGVNYVNGLTMLVAQAKYAMELFLDKTVSDQIIDKTVKKIEEETKNVVLIGMPGCGKSVIGEKVASLLGRQFIDTDQEIVKREKRSIYDIFEKDGEEYFRKVETEVLKSVCMGSGKVIATGGGVVKRKENQFALSCNGVVIYIYRPIDALALNDRPLSKDLTAVNKLYSERKQAYLSFSHFKVDNDKDIDSVVKGVVDLL